MGLDSTGFPGLPGSAMVRTETNRTYGKGGIS